MQLLEVVVPMGFNSSKQVIHNICLILSKAVDYQNVRLFDDPINQTLLQLTMLMIQSWITDFADNDSFILGTVVELIETMIHSAQFWAAFKQMPVTARLLNMSKRPNMNAFVKTKVISIVTAISKANHSMIRPPSPSQQRQMMQGMMREEDKKSMRDNTTYSYELDTAYKNP